MYRLNELAGNIWSIAIAILRLLFLTCNMLISGLHIVLFSKTEICNVEMQGLPWRCDRDKMNEQISFVDKLYRDNPDLVDIDPEHIEDIHPEDDDNGKK